MIRFRLNGREQAYDGDPEMPLLWYVRDFADLSGTKYGCGEGLCGSCTVHRNGKAIRSCTTPMSGVANQEIVTIEAFAADGALHPVQKAWIENSVPQCGYCQSGQIMQAIALLQEKPRPSDRDIETAMAGNICRCGTYQRIRAAIKQAAGLKA